MGNATSVAAATAAGIDPRHIRIWQNLATLQSNEARIRMLETLMAGGEYIAAAKRGGVYAGILQWIAAYRRGDSAVWPWLVAQHQQQVQQQQQQQQPHTHYSQQFAANTPPPAPHMTTQRGSIGIPVRDVPRPTTVAGVAGGMNIQMPTMNEPRKVVKENTTLATVPPPKRALDTLHESYRILSIDDTKPLSHETLKGAYKRAATRAHPDRGGSAEAFDEVTRAYFYLEEVINKLIPKGAKDAAGNDVRFSAPVTKEAALKARDVPLSKYEAEERAHRGSASTGAGSSRPALDEPKIALNPKNLNMDTFNRLFEENRLPDPENDGYGDWLKSNGEDRRLQNESQLRSKFNSEVFNRTFVEHGSGSGSGNSNGLTRYQAPDAITHHGGTELGAGRPSHFISPMGSKTGYTDLKYAYGEGSTFSHEVAGVKEEKRTFDAMKREREAAPVPLTAEEQRVLDALDRQRAAAEEERQRRLAVHDVAAEDVYSKLQRRLMIQ